MFQKFSDNARRVLAVAQYEAEMFGRPKMGTEHILLAMTIEARGAAGGILRNFGVNEDLVRQAIVDHIGLVEHEGKLLVTPNAHAVLNLALREAIKTQGERTVSVDTENLLLGIVIQSDCSAIRVLKALEVNIDTLGAVVAWSATGVEADVSMLVQSGQAEKALRLIKREIDAMEAVIGRARIVERNILSEATKNME